MPKNVSEPEIWLFVRAACLCQTSSAHSLLLLLYIYFFCLFRSVCWGADAKKGVVARFLGTVLRRHSRSSIFFFLPHFLACFSFHYKYIFSLLLLLPQPLNLLGREDEDATAGVPLYSSIGRHSQTWSEFRVLAERFFSCPR